MEVHPGAHGTGRCTEEIIMAAALRGKTTGGIAGNWLWHQADEAAYYKTVSRTIRRA